MDKKYTLVISTHEPLSDEEKQDVRRYGSIGIHNTGVPYMQREVQVMTVQLTEEEWRAIKKATIEAVG